MCWSESASLAMVATGAVATIVIARRGDPAAIWGTMAYFTGMEALQAAGYQVVDQCGTPANQALTLASYLHIALQPLVINAFCMAIAPTPVSAEMRKRVWGLAALASAMMVARLLPFDWAGTCKPGDIMCGPEWCLISGEWHIGWQLPLNALWPEALDLGFSRLQFLPYLAAAFVLPLFYGCWRFVIFSFAAGPVLASALTTNPHEMPAIWCMFSVGLLIVGLSPWIRHGIFQAHRQTDLAY